ncbi:TPA: hypothetical protein PW561_002165, partial [Mannheimia haemolytica]|nr:hypothetical protein [Mannheimia haemolytica]
VLKHRLHRNLTIKEITEIESVAVKRNNMNWLRSVSYIQYSYGMYDECFKNLKRLEESDSIIYSLDYMTMAECCKRDNEYEKYNLKELDNTFYYKYENNKSSTLLVTLSATNNFALQKYEYSSDKLFLTDNSHSYYMLSYNKIGKLIEKLCNDNNYRKICIVGLSKGGTGALYLFDYIQNHIPSVEIRCIAFSPQVNIYPFNRNLNIPSYRKLQEYIDCNTLIEHKVQNVKPIKNIILNSSQNKVFVFYGRNFTMDLIEARELKHFELVELPYSGHATVIPLTVPEGKTKEWLSNLTVDPDLAALGGITDLIDEIWEIYQNSNMRLYKFLDS